VPRERLAAARRVVVKVGTAVVTRPDGAVAIGRIGALAEQLHDLRTRGVEVLLVTSGAVGLGVQRLGLSSRPEPVVDRQACAAVGQGVLMGLYDAMFARLGAVCAQVLLTEEDFHFRRRFHNLTATLERLLELGAIPVINENDALSTAELALGKGQVFGDNDRLSALVATYLGADALVILSNVDAVYTRPPGDPGAERIATFAADAAWEEGAGSALGRGGMGSKIEAARVAARGGVTAVIASGLDATALRRVLAGEDVGTLFPAEPRMPRKRAWLAFATAPTGSIEVNAGARAAVLERHASLLPVGVVAVRGDFERGDVVRLCFEGEEFARGVTQRSAAELRAVAEPGRARALVHRDDLVVL
jgi:glutamate 5-kinase